MDERINLTTNNPVKLLRDEFAMAALQGLLASRNGPAFGSQDMVEMVGLACRYADEMMARR